MRLLDVNTVGGGIAGSNSGTIIDCSVSGRITNSIQTIGGLAGANNSKIIRCHADMQVSGVFNVGGLVGWCSSEAYIIQCSSSGEVINDMESPPEDLRASAVGKSFSPTPLPGSAAEGLWGDWWETTTEG